MDSMTMDGSIYLTRAEGAEIRQDLKRVEADMAVVKDRQESQAETLNKILSLVQKGNSVRAMFVAGGSGIGGGIVAGAAYLAHWLSQ